jgi:CheY-like chemotaxis protein
VCLEIRDTGIGMDEETRERIFEPFFTTKGLSGGTGLGLASVYGTIKAHGGYIEVISTVGAGATFSIYLPATREDVDPTLDTGKIMLGKGTILVVDDDEAVLEACASILEYLKYTPLRAPTGEEAVELYRERAGEIDLVILDMILPDLGGGEVYDQLKAIDPGVKVLLASGYSLGGAAQAILERGCNDFIQKPFTIEQLSQKIGTVLGDAPAG